MIQSYKDLKVFQVSYDVAMEIFRMSAKFPKEELYSLTNQLRRSSRSVPANIVEGWAKREYENIFKRQLIDATGSIEETKLWLNFALDCKYIGQEEYGQVISRCDEIGKMLHGLHDNWKTYKK
ncbi:MAG: four helix bundle protein [bacterium]